LLDLSDLGKASALGGRDLATVGFDDAKRTLIAELKLSHAVGGADQLRPDLDRFRKVSGEEAVTEKSQHTRSMASFAQQVDKKLTNFFFNLVYLEDF
jgi:hypothetical protein